MSPSVIWRTGGQVLVAQLRLHNVDTAFCVPGERYLAVIHALHAAAHATRPVRCRPDGGAATLADAAGTSEGDGGGGNTGLLVGGGAALVALAGGAFVALRNRRASPQA